MLVQSQNNKAHASLSAQIDAYLASGGKVVQVDGFTEVAPRRTNLHVSEPKPKRSKKTMGGSVSSRPEWAACKACEKLILKYGLKKSDIAVLVGLSNTAIYHYFSGFIRPTAEMATQIEMIVQNLTGEKL